MHTTVEILLVEDEFLIALSLKKEMTKAGFNVIDNVATGEKAIEAVKLKSPDIVLMDIRLSGKIDGIEAAHEIRRFSKARIIFTTGFSNSETMARIAEFNPLGYIAKPVPINRLKTVISDFVTGQLETH